MREREREEERHGGNSDGVDRRKSQLLGEDLKWRRGGRRKRKPLRQGLATGQER